MKSIGISDTCYEDLLEYKNKKALLNKKSKYSFSDAIKDLLIESQTLSEWMKGKKQH
jgi:predicted CopG family antitoxin